MPKQKYWLEWYEKVCCTSCVKAESEEEALEKFIDGDIAVLDNTHYSKKDYVEDSVEVTEVEHLSNEQEILEHEQKYYKDQITKVQKRRIP